MRLRNMLPRRRTFGRHDDPHVVAFVNAYVHIFDYFIEVEKGLALKPPESKNLPMIDSPRTDRREWLGLTAALSAALAACRRAPQAAIEEGPKMLGKPVSAY